MTATLLFDGDCKFCRRWIRKWQGITGEKVSFRPYQEALPLFPRLSREECEKSVQLILPDQSVYSGAHAVFKALALGGRHRALELYEGFAPFAWAAEFAYRLVARHRPFFSRWV